MREHPTPVGDEPAHAEKCANGLRGSSRNYRQKVARFEVEWPQLDQARVLSVLRPPLAGKFELVTRRFVIPPDSQSKQRSIAYETQPPLGNTSLALGLACGFYSSARFCGQSQAAPAGQKDQEKTEVFVGKIIKARDGRYALLTDDQTGKGVYLDDQEKAKPFEGNNVKVTGVVEAAKNLVHVTDIRSLSIDSTICNQAWTSARPRPASIGRRTSELVFGRQVWRTCRDHHRGSGCHVSVSHHKRTKTRSPAVVRTREGFRHKYAACGLHRSRVEIRGGVASQHWLSFSLRHIPVATACRCQPFRGRYNLRRGHVRLTYAKPVGGG